MHATPPEIRILQVIRCLVTQPISNVLTDESRGEISRRPVAVYHRGRTDQQLSETSMRGGFRFLRRLACRDVAPGADDLRRLTVGTSDQVLFVIHPTIGAVLFAEAILHRVHAVLKEFRYGLFDADEIVRMDPLAPKERILEVFGRCVAEHSADIVADKGRREIATGFEAVDDRGR